MSWKPGQTPPPPPPPPTTTTTTACLGQAQGPQLLPAVRSLALGEVRQDDSHGEPSFPWCSHMETFHSHRGPPIAGWLWKMHEIPSMNEK